MYQYVLKPLLFLLSPEKAHHFSMKMLRFAIAIPGVAWVLKQCFNSGISDSTVNICGIAFPNSVGVAAGFDKDARYLKELQVLGFGHVEVGTLTPIAQSGNTRPRLFRLKKDAALLNRMGFNNHGVDNLINNVTNRQSNGVLGINIGKNFDTPVEQGKDDYLLCMDKVYEHATYITVNISSPNTPGLRSLQYGDALDDLLKSLKEKQAQLASLHNKTVPLLLKIEIR